MKNNNKFWGCTVVLTSVLALSTQVFSAPAGEDQIKVLTSAPKKNGETAFSYLVSWRSGDSYIRRANGLAFMNGPDQKKPTNAVDSAHRLERALNSAISYESPIDRGAVAKQNKGEAELLISNKEGFDFVQSTFRDYTNQELTYSLPGKTFQSAGVNVAIDIVLASAVEFIDGFSSAKTDVGSGGMVKVSISGLNPVEINTVGKTKEQIEKEIADALKSKANYSSTPIYPNFEEAKSAHSRNYKAFDGGEIQLPGLSAESITIDMTDPIFGVLAKFSFPDVNKPTDVAGKMPYLVGGIVTIVALLLFYTFRKIDKKNEEPES